MVFLLWFLSILNFAYTSDLGHGLGTDLLNVLEPRHFPDIPNEDSLNDYMNSPDTNNLNNDGTIQKHLLSILHNEKSNQVMLDSMHTKKHDTTGERRGKISNIDALDSNDNFQGGDNLLDSKSFTKRSAVGILKGFFGKSTSHAAGTPNPMYPVAQEVEIDSDFAGLVINLTDVIKTLNKNLGNLQLHLKKNDPYLMVKIPVKSGIAQTSEGNANRLKRDAEVDNIFDESKIVSKYDENKDTTVKLSENSNARSRNSDAKELNVTASDVLISGNIYVAANATKTKKKTTNETPTTDEIKKDESSWYTVSAEETGTNSISPTEDTAKQTDKDKEESKHVVDFKETTSKSIDINSNSSIELNAKGLKIDSNHTLGKIIQHSTKTNSHLRSYIPETEFIDLTRSYKSKEQMLHKIENTFQDIKEQILPAKDIKERYSSQVMYKIGYIVANLDTVEMALKKLKMKLTLNKDNWIFQRLLGVYKKLQLTRLLVDSIMTHLKTFTAR